MPTSRFIPIVLAVLAWPLLAVSARADHVPQLGRFWQEDPSGSGLPVLDDARWFAGRPPMVAPVFPDAGTMYRDGLNLHVAYGDSPLRNRDPMGLFFGAAMSGWDGHPNHGLSDPFDMVDEYIAEDAGAKAAALERVIGAARTAAYVTTYLASWIPGGVGAVAGITNGLLPVPASIQGTWVQTAMTAADSLSVTRLARHFASSALATGAHYFAQFGPRSVLRGEGSIARTVGTWKGNHHIVPMYMGGAENGVKKYLTHEQHVELHRLIDQAGGRYGIPPRSGPNGGTVAVERWLAGAGQRGAIQMRMALLEAYSSYDNLHGSNLWAELWNAMLSQPQWAK